MSGEAWIVAGLSALMVGGGIFIFQSAFGRLRLRRSIADTPTSRIRSAAMGKIELKGLARQLGVARTAPYSGRPCVWVQWKEEVEQISVDSKGRRQKSWQMVTQGVSSEPFQLDDTTGLLMVLPGGAEVDAPKVFEKIEPGFLSGRRRFREWRIDVDRPIYLLGVHRPARDSVPASVGQGRAGEAFLIAAKSEGELLTSLLWGTAARLVGGCALALGGAAVAVHFWGQP